MKKLWLVPGILAGGVASARVLSQRPLGHRLKAMIQKRLRAHMQRMLETMPEDSPPRLVMSVLPRLEEQNDEILALLRRHDVLVRESETGNQPVEAG